MKVLVYGWYHQGNLGDDLFIEAFQHLFPNLDLIFTDHITLEKLKDIDAVFFGGGSFLLDRPQITEQALLELNSKKILYLGVGVEADIHPVHMELMSHAKIIATRSPDQLQRLKCLNEKAIFIPDLVYALQSKTVLSKKKAQSVLIAPNINVVSQRSEPHWKHASWSYFKSEFTQFIDWLVDNGYEPAFFSMCRGLEINDDWAAHELISHMEKRNQKYLLQDRPNNIAEATALISKYNILITQRFHGIVLAEMTSTPYIAIHHHDKLKDSLPGSGEFLSYYNCSKQLFIDTFNKTIKMNFANTLPIESNIFKTFSEEVINSLI